MSHDFERIDDDPQPPPAEVYSEIQWSHDPAQGMYDDFDDAVIAALDSRRDSSNIDVMEFREPGIGDVDVDVLTDAAWDAAVSTLWEQESLAWDGGCADLETDGPSEARAALRAAIERMLKDHLDLSVAAFVPTGKVVTVNDCDGFDCDGEGCLICDDRRWVRVKTVTP